MDNDILDAAARVLAEDAIARILTNELSDETKSIIGGGMLLVVTVNADTMEVIVRGEETLG